MSNIWKMHVNLLHKRFSKTIENDTAKIRTFAISLLQYIYMITSTFFTASMKYLHNILSSVTKFKVEMRSTLF